ncbi:MAG TPA: M48 family metalloprotease, partial [Rheinheimera sp.]|nr:M48 family metalloprotease [Rheinheimera sp.]
EKSDDHTADQLRLSYSGLGIPAEQIRKTSLVASAELQSYLQQLADRIVAAWPGSKLTTQVQLINSYSFGPSVDQFGTIYVPLGMLESVESEDEIVALLAHEISHILLRHHERTDLIKQQQQTSSMLAELAEVFAVTKDTKVRKFNDSYRLTYEPSRTGEKTINKAHIYSYVINTLSDEVWSTAWARYQEEQADVLGMDLASTLGYAPRAAIYTLQRLESFQGQQQSILSQYYQQKQALVLNAVRTLDAETLKAEKDKLLSEVTDVAITAGADYLKRSHLSPADRDLALREYIRKEYTAESRKRPNANNWQQLKQQQNVQYVLNGYRAAFDANTMLVRGDLQKAEQRAMAALNPVTKGQPGIREVLYNVRIAQRKQQQAQQNLSYIENWSLASPEFFEEAVRFYMTRKQFNDALQLISVAETSLKSKEPFMIEKAVALSQIGDTAQSVNILQSCRKVESKKQLCESYLKRMGVEI